MRKFRLLALLITILAVAVLVSAQEKEEEITNKQVLEGIKLFKMGKSKEALAILEKEAKASPGDPDVFNAIAIIHSNEKNYEAALKSFDKAISLRDGNFKTLYNKLNLLVSLNRIDDAKAMLKSMTDKYPDNVTAWVNFGAILMQTGEREAALTCFNKATSLSSKDFDAFFKKGQVLMLLRKYAESKAAFEQALKIQPRLATARQGLAIVTDIIDKKSKGYIRVSQILVKDKALADQLKKELDSGKDFVALAVKNSVDASAKSGGHLGFLKKGDLVKVIEDAIFSLKANQISPVILSPLGYHIFKRIE